MLRPNDNSEVQLAESSGSAMTVLMTFVSSAATCGLAERGICFTIG
jgi:hypothetical protein